MKRADLSLILVAVRAFSPFAALAASPAELAEDVATLVASGAGVLMPDIDEPHVEEQCSKKMYAYVLRRRFSNKPVDLTIHICPKYFEEDSDTNNQIGVFVHEMSHLYLRTKDDYRWIQPSRQINNSFKFAQFYQEMVKNSATIYGVRATYIGWMNSAISGNW